MDTRLLCITVVLSSSVASGEIIQYRFAGTVSHLDDDSGITPGVRVGDAAHGLLTYDTLMPLVSANSTDDRRWFEAVPPFDPQIVQIVVGGRTFSAGPNSMLSALVLLDDQNPPDRLYFQNHDVREFSESDELIMVTFNLDNLTLDDRLPSRIDLSHGTGEAVVQLFESASYGASVSITSLTLVPESSTAALWLGAIVGLLSARAIGRRRAIHSAST